MMRAYFLTTCWVALPLMGFAATRKALSLEPVVICLGMGLLMLAYMHNKTIHLDEYGMTQGFSIFKTFIRYGAIAEARIGTASRGVPVFVISEKNSSRTITIPLKAFDQAELRHAVNEATLAAPHARFLMDALSWEPVDAS